MQKAYVKKGLIGFGVVAWIILAVTLVGAFAYMGIGLLIALLFVVIPIACILQMRGASRSKICIILAVLVTMMGVYEYYINKTCGAGCIRIDAFLYIPMLIAIFRGIFLLVKPNKPA
jgi:hypothetical protein